jgi:WD40 repeat protein
MHSLGSWNGQRASNSDIDEYDVLDSAENQLENAQVVHRKPPYRNDGLRVQVSTMSSDGWLCIAGGFAGEIIGVDCRTEALCFDWRVAGNVENAITNYIELFYRAEANDPGSLGRARHMATANNDCFVRIFDLERCGHAGTGSLPSHALLREIPFSWPVNHVGVQPLGSWHHPEPGALLAIAGDHTDVLLVDRKTGEAVMSLHGHRDYSFATAWHPNGIHLATGNQDGTFRIWDVRRTDVPLRYVFPARLGAVRSLQYSDDGRFLCVAEVADWVHIVDAFGGSHEDFDQHLSYPTDERYLYSRNEGYLSETVIDVFGEIAGVSFSPARGEYLFVGISDPTYGCLMQYRRNRESFSLSRWITS